MNTGGRFLFVLLALLLVGAAPAGERSDPTVGAENAERIVPDRDADETPGVPSEPAPAMPAVGDWGKWRVTLDAPFLEPDPHLSPAARDAQKPHREYILLLVVEGVTAKGLAIRFERLETNADRPATGSVEIDPDSFWTNLVSGGDTVRAAPLKTHTLTLQGTEHPCRFGNLFVPDPAGGTVTYERLFLNNFHLGPGYLRGPGLDVQLVAFGDAATRPPTLWTEPDARAAETTRQNTVPRGE